MVRERTPVLKMLRERGPRSRARSRQQFVARRFRLRYLVPFAFRRSAQYLRIRTDTALRAAADIARRRRGIGIHAAFTFDRRDYCMAWVGNSEAKVVGNKVTVDIALAAKRVAAPAPTPKKKRG